MPPRPPGLAGSCGDSKQHRDRGGGQMADPLHIHVELDVPLCVGVFPLRDAARHHLMTATAASRPLNTDTAA
jgi:hypothetical protein